MIGKNRQSRRRFLAGLMGLVAGLGLWKGLMTGLSFVWAGVKRTVLPKGTTRESLIYRNPAELDPRNLEVTPLQKFGTMGLTDYAVDLNQWRLQVEGAVAEPLRLRWEEVKQLPAVERKVLLICPGVFANYGRWRGCSVQTILERAGVDAGATHVEIRGPMGPYEKVTSVAMADVQAGKALLAYEVNGKPLPQRHGFPLRLVAEDSYGYEWVKYVYRLVAVAEPQSRG
jgi:DMSO/TMAO reductase YedYZ molybdopterin-dependent catalytic subunit